MQRHVAQPTAVRQMREMSNANTIDAGYDGGVRDSLDIANKEDSVEEQIPGMLGTTEVDFRGTTVRRPKPGLCIA